MVPIKDSVLNVWTKGFLLIFLATLRISADIQRKQRDVPLAVIKLTIICDKEFSSLLDYDEDRITSYWIHQIKDLEMIFRTLPSVKMLFRIETVLVLKETHEQPFIENSRDTNGTTDLDKMRESLGEWAYQKKDTISRKGIVILVTASDGHHDDIFTTNPDGACIIDEAKQEFKSLLIMRAIPSYFWYHNIDLANGMARLFGASDFNSLHSENSTRCREMGYITDKHFARTKNYFFSECTDETIYRYVMSDAGSCLKSPNIPKGLSNKKLELEFPLTMNRQCQLINNNTQVIAAKNDDRCYKVECYLNKTPNNQQFELYWPIYDTPCGESIEDNDMFCFRGSCLQKGTVIQNVQSGKCLSSSNTFKFDDALELEHCPEDPTKLDEFMLLDKGELGVYLKMPCTDVYYMNKCATVDDNGTYLVFDLCPNGNSSKFGWDLVDFDGESSEFLLCHRDSRMCAGYDGNFGVMLNAKQMFTDPSKRWKFYRNDSFSFKLTTGYIKRAMGNNVTYLSYYLDQDQPVKADSTVYTYYVILALVTAAGIAIVLIVVLSRYAMKRAMSGRNIDPNLAESLLNGNAEGINPSQDISGQADLMAYDKRWEFPEDRLKLGEKLGSGAFGIVLEAEATGILKQEMKTTVAVKTLPTRMTAEDLQNLMGELKILSHLGSHINVLNLLGACTMNIKKNGKLLVILEYCKYGNLRSYLHLHINNFVGKIEEETSCSDNNQTNFSNDLLRKNMYTVRELETETATEKRRRRQSSVVVNTLYNYISNTGDKTLDHRKCGDSKKITTNDLLSWGYQIARGMEYLASKRVLHGDLATRNCLLAEDNVVKISDFGLSKNLNKAYQYIYKKNAKKKTKLPMKWMAIESLKYGIFSSESDCWSYGVVLWELFTLGRTPYYEVNDPKLLLKYISDGHRMEKPKFAPSRIYDMMLQCWHNNPVERPSFSTLCGKIEEILGQELCKEYVQMTLDFQQTVSDNFANKAGILIEIEECSDAQQSSEFLNVPIKNHDGYEVPNAARVNDDKQSNVYSDNSKATINNNCSLVHQKNEGCIVAKFIKHKVDINVSSGYESVWTNSLENLQAG